MDSWHMHSFHWGKDDLQSKCFELGTWSRKEFILYLKAPLYFQKTKCSPNSYSRSNIHTRIFFRLAGNDYCYLIIRKVSDHLCPFFYLATSLSVELSAARQVVAQSGTTVIDAQLLKFD